MSAISLPDVSTSGTLVGGLVGWNDGPVGASFATGNVTGTDVAGGLIGRNIGMLIATHATGNVTVSGSPFCTPGVACPEGVGGLIGYALERTIASTLTTPFTYSTSSVEASYSTGSVSGDSTHILGSFAGNAERDTTTPSDSASFTNSYWDTGTSGQTLGVGSDDEDENGAIDGTETATAGVTGQTTAALKAPTGYTGIFANWNVTIPNVTARTGGPWNFGAATDYPVLRGLSALPSFAAGTATRSVAEELAAGASIGSPLTATDSDALSYKLVGADAIFFAINSMTGQLLTKTRLDYENPGDADGDNEYEFMIQARDGTTVAFQTVAVTVTDAIENLAAPIITGRCDRHGHGEQHGGRHLRGGRPRRRHQHLHVDTRRERRRCVRDQRRRRAHLRSRPGLRGPGRCEHEQHLRGDGPGGRRWDDGRLRRAGHGRWTWTSRRTSRLRGDRSGRHGGPTTPYHGGREPRRHGSSACHRRATRTERGRATR